MSELQNTPNEPTMEEILASIRKIITDDGAAADAAAPPPPMADDIIELTEQVAEAPADELVMFEETATAPEEQPEPEPEVVVPAPVALPVVTTPVETGLVSAAAGAAVGAALANLTQQLQVAEQKLPATTPLGDGQKTLEQLVMDALRPMLADWLDRNLPPLVEHMVAKEIERITRH